MNPRTELGRLKIAVLALWVLVNAILAGLHVEELLDRLLISAAVAIGVYLLARYALSRRDRASGAVHDR